MKRLLEVKKTTVDTHTRHSKTGKTFTVQQHEREYPQKSANDPDYEKYKVLNTGDVISKSKRGQVEVAVSSSQLRYRGRVRGTALPLRNNVANAKRDVEQHGLETAVGGAGAALTWKDK